MACEGKGEREGWSMKMIMQNFYEQKWGLSNMYDHWSLSSLGVTFVNPTLPDRLATDSGTRGPGWGVGGVGGRRACIAYVRTDCQQSIMLVNADELPRRASNKTEGNHLL